MLWKFHPLLFSLHLLSIQYHSCADFPIKQADKEWMQLEIDKKTLEDEKRTEVSIRMTDIIRLNVGGEIVVTTRQSLTAVPMFNGRWEKRMRHDMDTNLFLDFDPLLFRHLLEQLRQIKRNPSLRFTPPPSSSPFAVRSFDRMLKALGLDRSLPSTNAMVVMNVGGDRILTRQKSLDSSPSKKMMASGLVDADPRLFRHLLGQLREQKTSNPLYFRPPSAERMKSMNRMLSSIGLNPQPPSIPPYPACWQTTAVIVAGGRGRGDGRDQLNCPCGLFVDEDQTVYIADFWNDRIMEWKASATTGEVLAGGEGEGKRLNQLNGPTDVIVDRETILICDYGNRRVMRWPRRSSSLPSEGEIVIGNVSCSRLTMNNEGALYVSDWEKHEVRRYDKDGEKEGVLVAGGHERGDQLNQLNMPNYLFVDAQSTLYVSDLYNHRVMAWKKGAKEGIVVAGGNGQGGNLTQLSFPKGVWVDGNGHVYVVDDGNHRVVRWEKGAKEGTAIVGGKGEGAEPHQLSSPEGLFFDRHGHLYVAEHVNDRVQRFSLRLV